MIKFEPGRLRLLRTKKKVTATELAKRMGVSSAQIHRLENGDRRLTVDSLIAYCRALDVEPGHLFTPNTWVPITGVVDSEFEIQPIPPNTSDRVLAPPLADDVGSLAGLRWAPSRRFAPMHGHVAFFRRHEEGVPEIAWDKRCLIMRADSSQCLGWIVKQGESVHIDSGDGPVEFNVEVTWASPILCVMAPWAINNLQPPS